jgi:toxin FitB
VFALFGHRILPFDSAAASNYAEIVAERRRIGRPINDFDAQIAAIARSRGFRLATRNIADFEHTGLALIDPWV